MRNLPRTLTMVRHGESVGNLAVTRSEKGDHLAYSESFRRGHNSGWKITEQGEEQARLAGKWLRENGFGKFEVYRTSPFVRAIQTAALLGLPEAKWQEHPLLRERENTEADKFTQQELETGWQDEVRQRRDEPFFWKPPRGESMAEVMGRLIVLLEDLAEDEGKNVIWSTHGRVMWTARCLFENWGHDELKKRLQERDKKDYIGNGRIFQYRRQRAENKFSEMRTIDPVNLENSVLDWQPIKPRFFTNEELLARSGLFQTAE